MLFLNVQNLFDMRIKWLLSRLQMYVCMNVWTYIMCLCVEFFSLAKRDKLNILDDNDVLQYILMPSIFRRDCVFVRLTLQFKSKRKFNSLNWMEKIYSTRFMNAWEWKRDFIYLFENVKACQVIMQSGTKKISVKMIDVLWSLINNAEPWLVNEILIKYAYLTHFSNSNENQASHFHSHCSTTIFT